MTNDKKIAPINFTLVADIAMSIAGLHAWAEDKDDKAVQWARKQANKKLQGFPEHVVRACILPEVDEIIKDRRQLMLVEDKCDNSESANLECELLKYDTDQQGMMAYFNHIEAVADRALEKDQKLEAKTGVNRTTVDNRRYWRNVTSEEILHMEALQDQYTLGIMSREMVRQQLANIYGAYDKLLAKVKWQTGHDGQVTGYIRGCGNSATNLRALCNTALVILEELGFRILDKWWKTNSKGEPAVHEFTERKERQERSGEDWKEESYTLFYDRMGAADRMDLDYEGKLLNLDLIE